jgi:hypothetical protein
VATPTDFALDFGKGHKSSPSFDASNGTYGPDAMFIEQYCLDVNAF